MLKTDWMKLACFNFLFAGLVLKSGKMIAPCSLVQMYFTMVKEIFSSQCPMQKQTIKAANFKIFGLKSLFH